MDLYQEDGPQSFSEVLNIDIVECCNVKLQMSKVNRKTTQNIIRNLLKDFKGKSYNKLFENDFKVTKQNFLGTTSKKQEEDLSSLPNNF